MKSVSNEEQLKRVNSVNWAVKMNLIWKVGSIEKEKNFKKRRPPKTIFKKDLLKITFETNIGSLEPIDPVPTTALVKFASENLFRESEFRRKIEWLRENGIVKGTK